MITILVAKEEEAAAALLREGCEWMEMNVMEFLEGGVMHQ